MPANPYGMVIFAKSGGGMPNPNLAEQAALLSHLGHLPDASEVAVWMAEKTHENNKPDAALERRIEALEAEMFGSANRKRTTRYGARPIA